MNTPYTKQCAHDLSKTQTHESPEGLRLSVTHLTHPQTEGHRRPSTQSAIAQRTIGHDGVCGDEGEEDHSSIWSLGWSAPGVSPFRLSFLNLEVERQMSETGGMYTPTFRRSSRRGEDRMAR